MRFLVKRKGEVLEILQRHAYMRHFFEIVHPLPNSDEDSSCVCKPGFYIMPTKDALDLPLPKRHSLLAAGIDLCANVHEPVCIKKGTRVLIPAGIKIALPVGYEAQVRPRSGLAFDYGVTVLNAPGTVDADYRGELSVLLINLGNEDFMVNRGDRIAQLVVAKVEMVGLTVADVLPESVRGEGGYGSTGV